MRKKAFLRRWMDVEESELPREVRERLTGDPALLRTYRRLRTAARFAALKRYEGPDADTRLRIERSIRRAIRTAPEEQTAGAAFPAVVWPALRYGAAFLFIGFLTAHAVGLSSLSPVTDDALEPARATVAGSDFHPPVPPAPAPSSDLQQLPASLLMAASNQPVRRFRSAGGATFVDFRY